MSVEVGRQVEVECLGLYQELFWGTGKTLRLVANSLGHKDSVARILVDNIPGGVKQEGETTTLYQAAIATLAALARENGPIMYQFSTDNERMKYFGYNILPYIVGQDGQPKHDGERLFMYFYF
jgi:hypothetical protein